jgi:hypothetical protein
LARTCQALYSGDDGGSRLVSYHKRVLLPVDDGENGRRVVAKVLWRVAREVRAATVAANRKSPVNRARQTEAAVATVAARDRIRAVIMEICCLCVCQVPIADDPTCRVIGAIVLRSPEL